MYSNILVLDDGTEIQANQTGSTITNLVYTATVSSTTDLCPGAACAAKIEFTVWVQPGSSLAFTSGTRVKYYQEDAGGSRTLVGTFWAVKPTKQTRNSYKVYAYDAVSKLDGIQSTWLRSIQDDFPMSLWSFAQAVAQQCGVTLDNSSLPRSGSYQVQAFYGDNLTGRQMLQWVAEASCTFLRATPDGGIEFVWYIQNAATGIFPDATEHWVALDLSGQILTCSDGSIWTYKQNTAAYRSGGLSYEEYSTALLDKVQIKQTDDDVGVIYPADATGSNALVIQGNLLLTTDTAAALQPVAQAIFETMQRISYTPLKASLFSDGRVFAAGQIVTVTYPQGNALQAYLMTVQQQGGKISVECTGNASRDGTAAVNEQKYTNLDGKILKIKTSVDGLKITAADLAGGMASLELTVDGLRTEVSGKLDGEDAQTLIDQSLQGISLSASTSGTTSTLTLKAGDVTLSSAQINFSGLVTFSDLSTSGKTTISGDNIKTGTIKGNSGSSLWSLDSGTFISGVSNSTRVEINFNGIRWYSSNYLTGVLYSEYGKTYLGSNSTYTFLGWFSSGYPSINANNQKYDDNFGGLYYDHGSRLIHCVAEKFEIPGRIECASLAVNGREI